MICEKLPAQEVMRIFRQDCGARLHWGKAGWPQWGACFDGAREYPDSWCHFGCAVQVLRASTQPDPLCIAVPSVPERMPCLVEKLDTVMSNVPGHAPLWRQFLTFL